jgi:hypothetical protein
MYQIHIKFTVNAQFRQSYCNTSGEFYNNNGKPLPSLKQGIEDMKAYAANTLNLLRLLANLDAVEEYYQKEMEKGTSVDFQAVTKAVTALTAGAFEISEDNLKPTHYSKNKASITCYAGTITIVLKKVN